MSGVVDGVSLGRLKPGLMYDLPSHLGNYLVTSGDAQAILSNAPALVVPLNEGGAYNDGPLTGGVHVSGTDVAEDRRLKRRRKTD